MNEQKATSKSSIEWTRVRHLTSIRPGYTWNPLTGCAHACEWMMPDGHKAECYAKSITEKFGRGAFEQVVFHPERLEEPFKVSTPSGIFCCSMSDLFALNVNDANINDIIGVMRQASQHIFFILTKNAPRLLKFRFPPNVWVGVSSPPDFMFGKQLNEHMQRRMLETSLRVLSDVDVPIRWMSFEPLSWDCAWIVEQFPGTLQWAVVGAASDGNRHYEPDGVHLFNLVDELDSQDVPVFFKGNLECSARASADWREDFPLVERREEKFKQLEL